MYDGVATFWKQHLDFVEKIEMSQIEFYALNKINSQCPLRLYGMQNQLDYINNSTGIIKLMDAILKAQKSWVPLKQNINTTISVSCKWTKKI